MAQNLLARGLESFLPLYEEERRWKNRQTVTLTLPLFPGYVFARFAYPERLRVVSLPGVVSIVNGAENAESIPDQYLRTLQAGLALGRVQPFREAVVGDRVRVVRGPMAGIEGTLIHFRSKFRVVLSLAGIGQNASIEVLRGEIEPIAAHGVAGVA